MGFSERIGGIYSGIEGKFYAGMDFLADRGIPVYSAIDPLEERGIPAFPIAVAGLLLLLFLLYGFAFLSSPSVSVSLSITDKSGTGLSGVTIEITDAKGGGRIDVGSTTFRDGQAITVPRGIGGKVLLLASKDGYEPSGPVEVPLSSASVSASVVLKKITVLIPGSLRLADGAGNPVEGATITANFADAQITCDEQGKGSYTCVGVAQGEKAGIIITHPNYEQKQADATFSKDTPVQIELVPKAISLQGAGNLIVRTFDAETKQRIGNFTVQVYDARDDQLITGTTETDGDGEQVLKIPNGTSVRLVVKRDEYITYNSADVGENFTTLPPEVKREIYLQKGTNALTVGVFDATGRPLPSIAVNLFSSGEEMLATKDTSLAGESVFEGLDAQRAYYAGAWNEQYLPAVQKVELSKSNRATLVLLRGTAANSGSLTVYTADEKGVPINDASLLFSFEDGNGTSPLGIPPQKSDVTGKFAILAPLNANLLIRASKGTLEGQASVKVLETFKNEAFITLREPYSQVALKVLDKDGKELQKGFISITGGTDVLVEGEYEPGLVFNPKGNEYVNVSFTDDAGNAFEEEVYVKDVNSVTVSPAGASSSGTAPDTEFLGVFNIDGTKADGLAKGVDYFLKFRVNFSSGTAKNGLHVRLGDDTVNFVDSQDAGIIGFSSSGASSFYGRSYSPNPAPGFEGLDFENSGSEGRYNKWLELYFQSAGEKVVKVRVKAKETATEPEIGVHYRAWSTIGNMVYRTPQDPEMKLQQFSSTRTSLYAETKAEKVKILEAGASCKNDLCASYKFVHSSGSEFAPGKFKAVLGELYSLDVSLSPSVSKTVTIKATTAKQNPKIGFQGFGIDNYANFPDLNSQDTAVQVDNVPARPGESTGVRLFFKALRAENSSITLQLISGETVLNEQFYFDIFREKAMLLRTSPENVSFGEDFAITLLGDDKSPITNAQVSLSDSSGNHLLTIAGTNSANKGAGGRYFVKNTFSAGTIKYEIRTDGYRGLDGTLEVTKDGVLRFSADSAYIAIQKSPKSAQVSLDLTNASTQGVQEIAFEIRPIAPLPSGMELQATPVSNIAPNTSQRISITASYTGENETAHAEARIIARGKTQSGLTVIAETKIVVDYNPKIPQDCLEFSKERLAIYVASGMEDRSFYDQQFANYYNNNPDYAGNPGIPSAPGQLRPTDPSSYYRYNNFTTTSSDTFTAKLAQRPECQIQLELKPESIAQGGTGQGGIEVQSGEIRLLPQTGALGTSTGGAGPNSSTLPQGNSISGASGQGSSGQPTLSGSRRSDVQEVTITVTNNTVRNYASKQRFGFDVVYRADGFEKSIPVDVFIWNPRYALQVTRNVELYLGPNDQGVFSAQVPLFVQNIGEADIENVDFRVSSSTSRGNVDLQIIPPYPIQFLKKGGQIFPPKTIVAQVMRNEKTTIDEIKQLEITGVINGQTFDFGPVIINAHVSAAQCIIVTPSNMVFFSTSTDTARTQEITVRNTCAEEVRILDITHPTLGRNTLSMAPLGTILPPHSQAKFNMVLDIRESYSAASIPVRLKTLLVRSGAPLDSNPIFIDFKLGKDVGKGEAASEPITLPVCEGGTKTVRFPITASGTNPLCDNSYCDAAQLSNYLTDRINEAVVDAEKQITNRSAEIQKVDCDQFDLARGFCRFSDLGVKLKPFNVYMSQDNISAALLQKSIEQKQGAVKSFRVDFTQGRDTGEYLGGYSKQIFMNNNFRGCGAYNISLNGSVRVEGTRLVPELMNVIVDISSENPGTSGRQLTEQCLGRVQNFNNFLPRDEGLNPNQRLDTWLGVVEAKDRALEDVSKDIAKTILGSDKRSIQGAQGSNVLSLHLGSEQSYLVRIEMEKVESESPVALKGFIRDAVGTDEKLQAQIAKNASQAIGELRNNSIDGCIGEDESYLLLKGTSDIGRFGIEVKGQIPVQYNNAACLDFNVTSDIKETINLSARRTSGFAEYGITTESPFFRAGIEPGKPESTTKITQVKVEKLEPKTNRFIGQARVCVVGNSQLAQAQGKTIALAASRQDAKKSKKPAEEPEVRLAVCGIHPYRFIADAAEKMKAPTKTGQYYYATFIWKGSPEQLNLAGLSKLADIKALADKAKLRVESKTGPDAKDTSEIVSAKRKAAASYLAVCSVTDLATSALRPVIGVVGWALNTIFDCLVPWSYMMWGESDIFKDITGAINKALEVLGPIKSLMDATLGGLGTALKAAFKFMGIHGFDDAQNNLASLAQNPEGFNANVVNAMVPAAIIKDSILAAQATFGAQVYGGAAYTSGGLGIELSKSQLVAKNIAGTISGHIEESAFGGQGNAFTEELNGKLAENIKANLQKAGLAKAPIRGAKLDEKEIQKAIIEAIDKTGKDADVLRAYADSRSGLSADNAKASNVTDDVIETLSKDMKLDAGDYGTKSLTVNAVPGAGPGGLTYETAQNIATKPEITSLETAIRNDVISKLKTNLGGIPSLDGLEGEIGNVKLNFETEEVMGTRTTGTPATGIGTEQVASRTKVKVTKENVDSMLKEINAKMKDHIRAKIASMPVPAAGAAAPVLTDYEKAIQKKFGTSGFKKLQFNTDEAAKATKLSILKPKNLLLLAKNLLKEGAFGLLANYFGMSAYDWVLTKELDKIKNKPKVTSVQDERAKAGVAILGQSFESIDTSGKLTINKYATYRMAVSNATGQQRITFEYAKDGIPTGTPKDFVIEDCTNPGFEQGIGDALPGLLPDADKPPRFFLENPKLAVLYPAIVNNYYTTQKSGEINGVLIASAAKKYGDSMNSIGINMEALLASIGALKTSLGTGVDPPNTIMFGCNLKSAKEQDVYRNAVCAADKLAKYRDTCSAGDTTARLSCLLQKYNEDAANQNGNTIGNLTPEQFRQLYDSWNALPYSAS